MNNRPYLDKLVTSPHIPRQDGQTGYCSRKLIPDLSCSGIHSEFEPKTIPTTSADGKMTKVFVMNAYRTMRELQRGITEQDAQEEIFKLDHRQYIDNLLVDMEASKQDKHERRMKHWKTTKDSLGFHGSFESSFGDKFSSTRADFGAGNSRSDSPMNFAEDAPSRDIDFEAARRMAVENVSKSTTRVRIDESNNTGSINRVRSTDSRDHHSHHSLSSGKSVASADGHGFSRPSSSLKKVKTHSRMALFKSLLEVVEPPVSPKKRFGSICNNNDGNVSMRRSLNPVNFAETTGSVKVKDY
jgi:hypothetical protein